MGSEHRFLTDSDRDRAVRAAAELGAELGYGELRTEQIAGRAGISRERFEELLGDKQAASQAAIEAILAAVVEIMADLYSPDRSEGESYLLGIRAILGLMSREPAFAHISYTAARQMMPPDLKAILDDGSNLLAVMLDRLREHSAFKDQPPKAARAALGGAEAVVRREIALGTMEDLERLVPDFIYAATVPFLGQSDALRFARQGAALLEPSNEQG